MEKVRLGIVSKRRRPRDEPSSKRRKAVAKVSNGFTADDSNEVPVVINLVKPPSRLTLYDVIMDSALMETSFGPLNSMAITSVVGIILSFMGLGDAIRWFQDNDEKANPVAPLLKSLMVARFSIILEADKQKWWAWSCEHAMADPDESITHHNKGQLEHQTFAAMTFSKNLQLAITHQSFLAIQCVAEVERIYARFQCVPQEEDEEDDKEQTDVRPQEWKDWRKAKTSAFCQTVHLAILQTIRDDDFTMFQWLLELNPPFYQLWVKRCIALKRTQMIEHLLFKQKFKLVSDYASLAPDVEMLTWLIGKRFPVSSSLMDNVIEHGREDMFDVLLAHGVKAATAPNLFLRTAIYNNRRSMIVKLHQYGYGCSTEVMVWALCADQLLDSTSFWTQQESKEAKAHRERAEKLLRDRVETIATLYRTFFATKHVVIENLAEHDIFLDRILYRLRNEHATDDWNTCPFYLTNLLKWMTANRWNDLSYSLLQSAAIRQQSMDDLEFCLTFPFPPPTVNHMDQAILQFSDLICHRLLQSGVSCSHVGFLKLVSLAQSEPRLWPRVETLMHHPVCRDAVRIQGVLPMIQKKSVYDRCLQRDEFSGMTAETPNVEMIPVEDEL